MKLFSHDKQCSATKEDKNGNGMWRCLKRKGHSGPHEGGFPKMKWITSPLAETEES